MLKIIGFLLGITIINVHEDIIKSNDFNDSNPKSSHFYYLQGKNFSENGIHTKAIENLNLALELTTRLDTLAVLIKNEIGNVYFSMKNYTTSKKLYSEALELSIQIKFLRGKAITLALLGSVEEKEGNYLEALKLQKKSLEIFLKIKDNNGTAHVKLNIGSIYEDLNQFSNAHTYFQSAYQLLKGKNNYSEADILNNLGDIFRKQNQTDSALFYSHKSLDLARKINQPKLIESAYKDLAKTYSIIEDYKKAYEYRLKSNEYKEIVLNNQNARQLNILQTIYDSHRKEAEIKLLKEQNKVNLVNQKLLIVVVLCIILISAILGYIYQKRIKTQQKIQKYKQRILKAELEKKQALEKTLQNDIQLKTASLTKYSLHLSQKNKILTDISSDLKKISIRNNIDYKSKLKNISKDIDFKLKHDDQWIDFNNLFKEIHPDFSKQLTQISTEKLSSSEIKLAMLLRLNLTSKEIAEILNVTPDSVRIARYRLRKKLPISPKEDLVNFMIHL
ncbi:tetratricopeptide repeat protein [Tenacibaculum skagerrakense]|uniref:Tetratricopeptide repeat protein n=1 Tax=Tenacibaculum skagerrakense TaxID=186571 RepID=A0A4R2NN56_9FLAO|nr:tetratricopeptide repeat protein [Tenacibaculum skagerrakense]TCP22962.1 tetratricopeptide repeat protein [Tenacibaculum skagerrakense]